MPAQISLFLALAGISQALWMILVFPIIQPRIGTGGVLRGCATVWPLLFILNPAANYVLKAHMDGVFWAVASVTVVLGSGCAMAFSECSSNDVLYSAFF
jgi:hypothetical protein